MGDTDRLGHKCSVRLEALDMQGLGAMERHGKRADGKARRRRVRDADPLVHGGLNLRELFERHVKGVRRNAAQKKPVGHLLFQFPTGLKLEREGHEKWLLDAAMAFAQRTCGGNAVFAARTDRDEKNRHTVDVFIAPRYVKTTKAGEAEWTAVSRFHRPLCRRHADEIRRRHGGSFSEGPRAQGMALQSEFLGYLREEWQLDIDDKAEKASPEPDRDEPEVYAAKRMREANAAEARARAEREAADRRIGEADRIARERGRELDSTRAKLRAASAELAEAEAEVERLREAKERVEAWLRGKWSPSGPTREAVLARYGGG